MMTRGFINASQARNNHSARSLIHFEIATIETQILVFSNAGYREINVNFTEITDVDIKPFQVVSNITGNIFTVVGHGYTSGSTVEFKSTETLPSPLFSNREYIIDVISNNTFSVGELNNIGTGVISVKEVIESEKYFKAWKTFYLYPFAESYLGVMTSVENHFKSLGYNITRIENSLTKTFSWRIEW